MQCRFNYFDDKDDIIDDALGANRALHVFLFDAKSKLVYRGSIDNNYQNKSEVTNLT